MQFNIPVPATLAEFKQFSDVTCLRQTLSELTQFVVKPNAGSQGNGILVIKDKIEQNDKHNFVSASNKNISYQQIESLIFEILSGNYSQLGDSDIAYIEPLIQQDPLLHNIAPFGLCDIRVVVIKGQIVSALLRIPTSQSSGKANLHQGALGAAIELSTGQVTRCLQQGKVIKQHPDTKQNIVGLTLPHWPQILQICQLCTQAVELGYMGIDICLDKDQGPLVLEINGRPGLEIQNINQRSLLSQTSTVPIDIDTNPTAPMCQTASVAC